MQVILDSLFARPGSAPIWGGKKGEFRDWTKIQHESTQARKTNVVNSAALPNFESHCGCRAKPSFVQPPRGHLQSDVIVRTFKTCTTRGGGSKLRSGRQFSSRTISKNRRYLRQGTDEMDRKKCGRLHCFYGLCR